SAAFVLAGCVYHQPASSPSNHIVETAAAQSMVQSAAHLVAVAQDIRAMAVPLQAVPVHPAGRLMLARNQRAINPYFEKGPTKWRAYCARQAPDCAQRLDGRMSVPFSASLWSDLQVVNQNINANIRYTPDPENGQGADKWVRPILTGPYRAEAAGDCEDYVLAKRHALLAMGLPAGALRFTLVSRGTSKGADHAVLVVATDYGDYVLDNVKDAVRPVEATTYRYISMHLPKRSDPHRFRHTLPRPVMVPGDDQRLAAL
ncbi:MAG: transglutaminase-like cysteine peptidase, partial [Alphaproteobacteria bacterium]